MQKDIKLLFQHRYLVIAASITLSIAYLSLSKPFDIGLTVPINNVDKIKHAFAYFVLSYSWMLVFYQRGDLTKYRKILCLFLFLYGVLMEVLQITITSYRQGDFLDLLANFSGIFICYLFFNKIRRKISVKL